MKTIKKEIQWLLKEKYSTDYNGFKTLPKSKQKQAQKDIKRIAKGEPVDYVIGFAEFLGCRIDLSKKPLIPRKETEYWTAIAIDEIKKFVLKKMAKPRVLDMFAGSGCIGTAVINHVQDCEVVLADKDPNAIKQIKINLQTNNRLIRTNKTYKDTAQRKVVKSDIFSKLKAKDKFDFILANPPYIPTLRKNKIQKSVLKYEPKQALFGGKDGLLYIDKFLKNAGKYLNQEGKIFMEFDPPQKKKIEKLMAKCKYSKWEFAKDQFGKDRWVTIENSQD